MSQIQTVKEKSGLLALATSSLIASSTKLSISPEDEFSSDVEKKKSLKVSIVALSKNSKVIFKKTRDDHIRNLIHKDVVEIKINKNHITTKNKGRKISSEGLLNHCHPYEIVRKECKDFKIGMMLS